MSDTRLRELERAAAAGDLEAHGRLLQERVRQGSLDPERIELLAYCFWPPAWAALGWEPHGWSGNPAESSRSRLFKRTGQEGLYQIYARFRRWAHGLKRWGYEAAARVGVAAARHRWPSWSDQFAALEKKGWDMPCRRERIFYLLHMLDAHVTLPDGHPLVYQIKGPDGWFPRSYERASRFTLEHEGRALSSSGPVTRAFGRLGEEDPRIAPTTFGDLGIFAGTKNYHWLAEALEEACDTDAVNDAQPCMACGRVWSEHRDGGSDHDFDPVDDEASWDRHVRRREGAVFEAIRNELVPWVLGERDPVRDRIDAATAEAREEP
jgi:hypothetical protein